MKYFTHPAGKFIIKIPVEWQYKNIEAGYKEENPYSFELYDNEDTGCFQISSYSEQEKPFKKTLKIQPYNTDKLEFLNQRMDGGGFNMHLWYAIVEDHLFMAKYIYDTGKENSDEIIKELKKVEKSLETLQLLSPDKWEKAIEIDRYEKFNASLAASFDLLYKAYENESFIEIIIIIANQIDAYLRLAIVMTKQLNDKTNNIDTTFLYQGEGDKPIFERKIYSIAQELCIIDSQLFNKLESLYGERNKMVHRYIISDLKTREILFLSKDYVEVCEEVRLILQSTENRQFKEQIGIHGGNRNPEEEHTPENITLIHSLVNDKHLLERLKRKIENPESNNPPPNN